MPIIQNYDSCLVLSKYKIGHTYVFYILKSNMHRLAKAVETNFATHIKILNDSIQAVKNVIKNNEQQLNFTRSIGLVVDTHKSTCPKDIDYITVLFRTESNDFVLNKYIVNFTKTKNSNNERSPYYDFLDL